MATPVKNIHFFKVLIGMTVLLITFIYGCNNSASKEEKTDTVTTPKDSIIKMGVDTTKTDTSGKGGQPTPLKH